MNPSFTASEGHRSPTPIQSRALLSQCRDIARGRLRRIAADALQRMEADLFAIAEGSKSREQQNVLFDVIAKVRDNRDEMARTFEKMVGRVFDERLLGSDNKKSQTRETEAFAENLKLVDDGSIMDSIVVSDLAKRTKLKVEPKQMFGLRARIGHLMGLEQVEDEHNPLGPEAIIEALDRTCGEYTTDTAAKRSLLSVFQPYVADGMSDVYAEVNAMLVARNVLPKIKPHIQRAANGPSSIPGIGALEAALNATGPNSLTGPHSLSQLMAATQPFRAGAMDGMNGMSATMPFRTPGGSPMSATQPFRTPGMGSGPFGTGSLAGTQPMRVGLTPEATAALAKIAVGPPEARRQIVRMLAEPSRHAFDAAIATPATPELVDQLNELQNQLAITGSLTQSWLRSLDQDVRNQSHPLDQLTIDFVAALFDMIFHDRTISDAVKGELARMQIVAVKAAIIDRTFFARRQHPMRHFLDRIAECAGDPNLDTSAGAPFVTGLRCIVDELNSNFAEDLTLISAAIEKLEALIVANSAAEEEKTRINTAEIEQAERREIATRMAGAEFKRRLPEDAPEFLRSFMLQWWTAALVDAFLHDRKGEDSWADRLGVIDQLMWSVGKLPSTAVGKLAALLPKLMRDLSRGMTAAEVPQSERAQFFDALMEAHTKVVNEAKAAPRPATASGAASAEGTASEPPVKPLAPLEADSLDFSTAAAGEPGSFHQHFVNAIEKNALVEFVASDPAGNPVWQRLKLSWVSPKRMVFLFTARLTKARQLSRDELVTALQSGTARLVDASEGYLDQAIQAIAVNPS
jgi:hypothetical protein